MAILRVDLVIVISAERKSQVEERSPREAAAVRVRVSGVTPVYFDISETARTSKRAQLGKQCGSPPCVTGENCLSTAVKQLCLLRACASV